MAEVFRVIQAIPHEELIGCIEAHPAGGGLPSVHALVQKRAHLEARGTPRVEARKQPLQHGAAVDDVLHDEHGPALE
jgi:hypothetical protein